MEQHFILLEQAAGSEDGNVRKTAALCLGLLNLPRSANVLIKLTRDKVWQVREAAVKSLGKLGFPETADAVVRLLQVEGGDVRKAIMECSSLKAPPPEKKPAGGPMAAAGGNKKKNEEVWQVKKAAALALSNIKPAIAVDGLIAGLSHANPSVIMASMVGLMKLQAQKSEEKIIELLDHEDWKIQKTAITVLGRLRSEQCLQRIIDIYRDTIHESVKVEVIVALNNVKNEGTFPLYLRAAEDESKEVRKVAAIALGNTKNEEYCEALIPLLQDPSPHVRKSAADSLVNLKATEHLEDIVPLIQDPDEDVQVSASIALGKLFLVAKL